MNDRIEGAGTRQMFEGAGTRHGHAQSSQGADPRMVTGDGRFTDDENRPFQAHAAFLRAPIGAGRLGFIPRKHEAAVRLTHDPNQTTLSGGGDAGGVIRTIRGVGYMFAHPVKRV